MRSVIVRALLTVPLVAADDEYLNWDAKNASQVALRLRAAGQVGKSMDFRVLSTDRSYNYKLRATWMTPSAIRGSARLQQIARSLSAGETKKLVFDAESAVGAGTVVMIEIDPREGSGVLPRDWVTTLGPRSESGQSVRTVKGTNTPNLREIPALSNGSRRDYAYEVFWVIFPLKTEEGAPLFGPNDGEAELTVRIHDKVGRVRWPIPEAENLRR